jgi:hypothetical protein
LKTVKTADLEREEGVTDEDENCEQWLRAEEYFHPGCIVHILLWKKMKIVPPEMERKATLNIKFPLCTTTTERTDINTTRIPEQKQIPTNLLSL